jgi:hypothetical protein
MPGIGPWNAREHSLPIAATQIIFVVLNFELLAPAIDSVLLQI